MIKLKRGSMGAGDLEVIFDDWKTWKYLVRLLFPVPLPPGIIDVTYNDIENSC